MKTFNVNLIVEADDNDATEGFVERVIESCFDSYDGYVATSVSASSIDETKECLYNFIKKVMTDRIRVGDFVNWPEAPNQFRKNKGGKVIKIKKGIAFIEGYIDGIIKKIPIKILTKL